MTVTAVPPWKLCVLLSSEAETALLLFRQAEQQAALLGAWFSLFSATKEALWHLINSTPTVNTNKHRAPKAEGLSNPCSPCMLPLCKCLTVASTCTPKCLLQGSQDLPSGHTPRNGLFLSYFDSTESASSKSHQLHNGLLQTPWQEGRGLPSPL